MNNDQVIQNLRRQVDNLTRERALARREILAHTEENRQLTRQSNNFRRQCEELRENLDDLNHENNDLHQQVQNLTGRLQNYKPKIYHKFWNNITAQTKRKRKAEYNGMFDEVLHRIPECKKAKISLRLGDEDVSFKWNIREMQTHRNNLRAAGNTIRDPQILPDDESQSDEEVSAQDKKKKKRSVVSLMDEYKLSQKGYHEFRYLISKKAPPIHHIKQERVNMSCQIPYIKHATVSSEA